MTGRWDVWEKDGQTFVERNDERVWRDGACWWVGRMDYRLDPSGDVLVSPSAKSRGISPAHIRLVVAAHLASLEPA